MRERGEQTARAAVYVKANFDGKTLVVRIPMCFQRRGGRKRILAPDGSEIVPSSKPQAEGTLVKALARAWRGQRMLDEGVYTSASEIGDAENISKSYGGRILHLALLAPDIIEADRCGKGVPVAAAGAAGTAAAGELGGAAGRLARGRHTTSVNHDTFP